MGNTQAYDAPSPSPSPSLSPTSPEIEAAHEHQGDNCGGCEQIEECKPLPYNPNLVGTIGYYTRAVIVCSGALDWAPKIEKSSGTFVATLAKAIKSADVPEQPKVTACGEPSTGEGNDIYVYPDQVKYIGVREEDIPIFIEDQLVKGEVSTRLKHVSVSGKYHVLVCTHNSRDKRCGRSGNQVLTALQTMMKERGVTDKVMVDGCSHVGGHKYAGVVVVYPPGDFYGYIGAKNVDQVVDHYLAPSKKPRANQFWRGKMGLDEDQQAKEAGLGAPKRKKDKGEKRKEKAEKRGGKEELGEKQEKKEEHEAEKGEKGEVEKKETTQST